MSRKLYVDNLSRVVGRDELERLFAGHGAVCSAQIIDHLQTANLTSTGLVEMASDDQGDAAIAALNGARHRGLPLVVGWTTPGAGGGESLTRMFEPMNIPREAEGREIGGGHGGFGRARPQRYPLPAPQASNP